MVAWQTHNLFQNFLNEGWLNMECLPNCLANIQSELVKSNKEVFRSSAGRKRSILARLAGIQCIVPHDRNLFLINLEKSLSSELDTIILQEEITWFQRSRCDWVWFGDRNTKFFHTKTITARKRIRINSLKIENGDWVTNEEALRGVASSHFQSLYGDLETGAKLVTSTSFPLLPTEASECLTRLVSLEAVRRAFFHEGF